VGFSVKITGLRHGICFRNISEVMPGHKVMSMSFLLIFMFNYVLTFSGYWFSCF
jgi:hypothetical protein